MTPFELRLCCIASSERLIDTQATNLWTAWHTAYLGRVDKFPHLSELMPKVLKHGEEIDKSSSAKPHDSSSVGRDLMSALLKLPAKFVNKDGEVTDVKPDDPSLLPSQGDAQ